MAYDLEYINLRTVADPQGFIEECDAGYHRLVETAAAQIAERACPIVLLSGPSGSGKTTTAMKVSEALKVHGINSHYVSMDDYYRDVGEGTPRTESGDYDLESPLCLDLELLGNDCKRLIAGDAVDIPHFDFTVRKRAAEPSKTVKLGADEIVIIEGIHALNSMFTYFVPEAFRLYVSTASDVSFRGETVFKSTWFRLVRRTVRDYNYRGTDAAGTMMMWANIRAGENRYITPFMPSADFRFDTSLAYEPAVFNDTATKLFRSVPDGIGRYKELKAVLPALQLFGSIDSDLVSGTSLLREFIS